MLLTLVREGFCEGGQACKAVLCVHSERNGGSEIWGAEMS